MTLSAAEKLGKGYVTGLTSNEAPNLEKIARRRLQLWAMTLLLLILSVTVMSIILFLNRDTNPVASPTGLLSIAVVVLVVIFSVYTIKKELDLQKEMEESSVEQELERLKKKRGESS